MYLLAMLGFLGVCSIGISGHREPNMLETKTFCQHAEADTWLWCMHFLETHGLAKSRTAWSPLKADKLKKNTHSSYFMGKVGRFILEHESLFGEMAIFPVLFRWATEVSISFWARGGTSFMTTLDSLRCGEHSPQARCMWSIETLSLRICCWDRDPQSLEVFVAAWVSSTWVQQTGQCFGVFNAGVFVMWKIHP